jgi:hypothetical protein
MSISSQFPPKAHTHTGRCEALKSFFKTLSKLDWFLCMDFNFQSGKFFEILLREWLSNVDFFSFLPVQPNGSCEQADRKRKSEALALSKSNHSQNFIYLWKEDCQACHSEIE